LIASPPSQSSQDRKEILLKNLCRSSILLRFALAGILLTSFGCAKLKPEPKRGMLTGDWSKPGKEGTEVIKLSYASNENVGGTINVTLGADGEHFRGEFVRISKESQGKPIAGRVVSAWGTVWDDYSPSKAEDPWLQNRAASSRSGEAGPGWDFYLRTHYSGRVIAFLSGNRDHTMRCRMELLNPAEGITGGGSGECQVSEGSTIKIRF
jgi:hypothetical protein